MCCVPCVADVRVASAAENIGPTVAVTCHTPPSRKQIPNNTSGDAADSNPPRWHKGKPAGNALAA